MKSGFNILRIIAMRRRAFNASHGERMRSHLIGIASAVPRNDKKVFTKTIISILLLIAVFFTGCFGGESTVDEDYHPGIPVLSAASLIFSEGATGESYDFGQRLADVDNELNLTVSNEGQSKALELSVDALSAGFQFKGGSYPGAGGSCGTELEGGSTCKLVIVFSSTTSGTYSSTLTLHYKNGKQTNNTKTLTLLLSGETHKVGEISFESTSSTAVRVTWTAVSSNPTADTFEYKLVKSTSLSDIDTAAEANNIASPEMDWAKATAATVSSLTSGTNYYFAVLVRDSSGGKVLYTPKSTYTTLLPPTGIGATAGSAQNSISWSSSTGATSYNIYYKTSSGVTTADTKITGVTSPYTHSSLSGANTYYYVVTAVNANGESAISSEVSSQPKPAAPGGVSASAGSSQNSISWSAVAGATSYNIYYKTSSGVTTSDTQISGVTSTYAHTSLSAANTYYYVVTAVNASGESSLSSEVSARPKPSAPTGVSAANGPIQNTISWSSSTGATSYNIYYKTSSGVSTSDTQITGVTSPYTHSSLTGSTYYYVVTAVNASGESSISSEVSATPYTVSWAQEAYLKAPNADASDNFGYSTSLDGDTAVVGAYSEDSNQTTITNGTTASSNNSTADSGSAYVFKRTGTTWAQEAYLKAPNPDGSDWFGIAVSISGDTVVVGAYREASNQTTITNGTTASSDNSAGLSGAAYVFKRTGTTWAQEAYLKAPNSEASDNFGNSASISNDTIVVGAPGESSNQTTITNGTTASGDNSANAAGAAYVFKRTGASWAQEAYLKAPNPDASDFFGYSVSISNDTVVVGAYAEDSNLTTITNGTTASGDNSASSAGAAYVFKRTGTTWAQEAFLKAPNNDSSDQFGFDVSISNDTVVVGAYAEDSNQTSITNGTTASSDNSSTNSGAVYVFKRTGTTWAQEAYLKAANSGVGDRFGWRANISNDTVVVGAYLEDSNQTTITNGTTASSDNSASDSGAAYVFKRTGTTWAEEAYLKAPNSEAFDWFGYSVSVSGDTIIVGTYSEDSNQTTITNGATASSNNSASASGAAYVFKRTQLLPTWSQQAYLKAPNTESSDTFGISVSVSGDTAIVGADGEDSNQTTITNGTTASSNNSATNSGAAYIFKRTGTTWAQEAYLKAPNAESGDYFGSSVSVSGDTAIVGANREDSNQTTITNGTTASGDNSATESGAAYIFKRTGTTWAQEAYLKAPNSESNDYFGNSVSVSGDTAIVGAYLEDSNQTTITNGTTASGDNSATESGAAYIFKRTGTTWAQEAYLKAPNSGSNDSFGYSVSLSHDTAIVGAYFEGSNQTTITNGTTASSDNSALASGAAYIFKRTGTTWAQEAYLKAPNSESGDEFGISVSLSHDTAIVGADGEDSNQTTITNGTTASSNNSATYSGAAYIFKRTGTTWAQEAYLKAPNSESYDYFGNSVSLSYDTAIVGADGEDSNQTTITNGTTASSNNSANASGAAYIFKRTGTTWAQEAYLKAPNSESNDYFGISVSVSDDTAIVGARLEDSSQTTITNGTTASSNSSASDSGAAYIFIRQ